MKLSEKNIVLGIATIILIFSFSFKIFILNYGTIGFDESGIVYIAEEISSGKELYADYFDHKPPFFHYLLAPIFYFLEPSFLSIKFTALVFDLVLMLTIFFIMIKFTNNYHALLATAIYSVFNLTLSLNTETLMTVFGLIGFYFYWKYQNVTNWKLLFLSGFFIAISIWFKQSGVVFFIAIVLHLGYLNYKKEISKSSLIKKIAILTSGILIISLPLLIYFLYNYGHSFLYSIIFFNLGLEASSSRIFQFGKGIYLLFIFSGFLLAIIISNLVLNKKMNLHSSENINLYFQLSILIFILISPEIFYQHFFQLWPFLIISSILVIFKSEIDLRKVFLVFLIIGILTIYLLTLNSAIRSLQSTPQESYNEIINYLNENIPKGSNFFSDTAIYSLLGKYSLTTGIIGITPAFAGELDYSFLCNLDYLVLTHRKYFLPEDIQECVTKNYSLQKKFENIGESYVEVWKKS